MVVSDMRMPEMDGVEFLNEVTRRFPKTIRFLLSSHADMESVYKSAGLMHQLLLKPSDEKTLSAAVLNAVKVENSPEGEKLRQLLSKIHRLECAGQRLSDESFVAGMLQIWRDALLKKLCRLQ